MKKVAILPGLMLFLVLGLPMPATADNHEAPQPLTDVWYIIPKQGMEAEFEAAVRKHVQFRVESGESREWSIYVPVLGEHLNIYQFRSCCHTYADLDKFEAEDMEKGLGAHWNDNVHQYVDHYHRYFERYDAEHSYMPEDAGPYKYYGVVSRYWRQGAGPGPNDARKKFSKIAKEQGWADEDHQWAWFSRIGGDPILMLVNPMENYADMAPADPSFYEFLSEKLGSEAAADALFEEFNSGFRRSDYTVWTEREDLTAVEND